MINKGLQLPKYLFVTAHPLRNPIILLDHVIDISVKRNQNGFEWIVSELCHCIEITQYLASGAYVEFCPEVVRDLDL